MENHSKNWTRKFYLTCSEIIEHTPSNVFLFLIFKIVELFQFIACVAALNYYLFPGSTTASYISDFFLVFIFEGALASYPTVLYVRYLAVCLSIMMCIIQIIVLIQMPKSAIRAKLSYLMQILIRILGIYSGIIECILIAPFQLVFTDIYKCDYFDYCFCLSHIIWLSFAIFANLCLLFSLVTIAFFGRDDSPLANTLNCSYNIYSSIVRVILKITMAVVIDLITDNSLSYVTVIIVGISFLLLIILRITQGDESISFVRTINTLQEVMLFVIGLIACLMTFVDKSETEMYLGVVLSPILYFTYDMFRSWREDKMIQSMLPCQIVKMTEIKQHLICLVKAVKEPETNDNFMRLVGIYYNHRTICDNVNCHCRSLAKFMKRKYGKPGVGVETALKKHNMMRCLANFKKKFEKVKTYWYQLVVSLFNEALTKHQKEPILHFYLSNLYYYLLGNPFMALYYCQISGTMKPSFIMKFQLSHHTLKIEKLLSKSAREEQQNKSKENKINVETNLEYMNQINKFLETAESCTHDNEMFWSTLLDKEPNTDKLCLYGQKIGEELQDIRKIYANVNNLNQNNSLFLYKYGLFLKHVMHDEIEAASVVVKLRNAQRLGNEHRWNCWDGASVLIRASGDRKTLAQIKDISCESEKLLGVTKKEILGMSCNRLMLPMIGENHDEWILNFYKNLKSKIMNAPFTCFVQHKSKYYVQCECLKCIVPNLDNGEVEFAVFLRSARKNIYTQLNVVQAEQKPGIIICASSGRIIGINRRTTKYLGIPPNVLEKEFALSHLLPECEKENVLKEFMSQEGREFQISLRQSKERMPQELIERNVEEEGKYKVIDENVEISMWGKLINETYGADSNTKAELKIFYFYPLMQKQIIAQGQEIVRKGDKQKLLADFSDDINEQKEGQENASIYNSSSCSSSHSSQSRHSEESILREFKYNLYERKYPFSVSILNKMLILLLVLFLGIHSK